MVSNHPNLSVSKPSTLRVEEKREETVTGQQYTASMYSFPDFEPVGWSMSGSKCCFLACIQVSQEAGQVFWYCHLFQNFPQFVVIHTVKDFSIVNEAEVDVFLEFSCFFYDPTNVGNLISGSSAFSKSCSNIWKFSVHVLLKPGLENFENYFPTVWNECKCTKYWLDEAQARIRIAGENINNLRYADNTTLMAESKGTKEPLEEGERGE